MKQPTLRINGRINLFPEFAPGVSIVYRYAKRDRRWRHASDEHRMTLRVFISHDDRRTMHINRDNYMERYDKAVQQLIDAGLTTEKLAARYDGMVSWQEIMDRFGLKEKKTETYKIYRPEGWVSPYSLPFAAAQHLPRKRKSK